MFIGRPNMYSIFWHGFTRALYDWNKISFILQSAWSRGQHATCLHKCFWHLQDSNDSVIRTFRCHWTPFNLNPFKGNIFLVFLSKRMIWHFYLFCHILVHSLKMSMHLKAYLHLLTIQLTIIKKFGYISIDSLKSLILIS